MPRENDAAAPAPPERALRVGRYLLAARVASGGMSSVHLGRLVGAAGFGRTVAIKQLHPHLAAQSEFVAMLLDEARLASRVQHPNVVSVSDVVQEEGQLLLVMEYVSGVSLAELLKMATDDRQEIPLPVVSAIMSAILHGLHAAHEATDEHGRPLGIVHRDVSPQNILVGADGVARLVDFGVAKAAGRLHTTADGRVKGKMAYMSPEQLRSGAVDRRADLYAAALVLWEAVTLHRPFGDDDPPLRRLIDDIPPPSSVVPGLPRALEAVIMRGLTQAPERRIATAREMALELEAAVPPAPVREVAAFVNELAEGLLRKRAAVLAHVERSTLIAGDDADDRTPSRTSALALTAVDRPPLRPGGGAARRAFVGFALVAIASVAAFYVLWRQGLAPALVLPGASAPAAAVQPAAAPVVEEVPPASEWEAPQEAAAKAAAAAPAGPATAEGAAPAVPAERQAKPPAIAAKKRRADSRAGPRKRGGRAAKTSVRCEPPFTIGPDGVKQYKLECL